MQNAVGERIIVYLKSSHITIRELASAIGANEHTLSNKFRGSIKVDTETLCDILKQCRELSPDWVLLGEGPMLRGVEAPAATENPQIVDMLQKQLEEEKQRNKEYWTMIQQLIKK